MRFHKELFKGSLLNVRDTETVRFEKGVKQRKLSSQNDEDMSYFPPGTLTDRPLNNME